MRGFPEIVGPSVGIELSSNYPPLFPAIGAFSYIHLGMINDFFVKLISPISAILTLYVTFRLGKLLGGESLGLLSSLLVAITPLFINHAFYANSYMLQTLLITSSVYFCTLYLKSEESKRGRFLIASGLLAGFALMTGYSSIPVILILTSFLTLKIRNNLKDITKFVVPLLLIGSPWYLRNLLVIGDPVFPYLTAMLSLPSTDTLMLRETLDGIRTVSYWTAFGKASPQPLDFLYLLGFHRGLFPAISLLTLTGILIANEKLRDIAVSVPCILIAIMVLSGFFTRYFLVVLPLSAILAANPLALLTRNKGGMVISSLIITLIILMPGLPGLFGGRNFIPHSPQLPPPSDVLFFFKRAGMDRYEMLKQEYGVDVDAWIWLDKHLNANEKVLTMEQRIYYIKDGDPNCFMFFDSDKVKPLHYVSDPERIVEWLKKHNIKYIFPSSYPLPRYVAQMPIVKLLGSPYFPIIYWNPMSHVYAVGPLSTPITNQSEVYINVGQWEGPFSVRGRVAIRISANELTPRIYVATPSPQLVTITYLDEGTGSLDINLYSPSINRWYLGLSGIKKNSSGTWKEHTFIVPADPSNFVELGLYAYEEFWISKIEVKPLDVIGRCHVGMIKGLSTNSTNPPTIMIYLPPLRGGEKVSVQTNSHGKNVSVEVFEGVIQLWETTKWWERHRMVARSPELPTWGEENPTLWWEAKEPGLYTIAVVLWDVYEPDTRVDISVAIGGGG